MSWTRRIGRRPIARVAVASAATLLSIAVTASATPPPAPPIVEYATGITPGAHPNVIAPGPDGAMWFTEYDGKIGRVTVDGRITELPSTGALTASAHPSGIVTGPDQNIWFTEFGVGQIGEIDPSSGRLVGEYPVPSGAGSQPEGITVGPDGALWFAEAGSGLIGRLDPSAVSPGTSDGITEYKTKFTDHFAAAAQPVQIITGPDRELWVTLAGSGGIDRIDPTLVSPGTTNGVAYFPLPSANSTPEGITVGPDNHLWVSEFGTTGTTPAVVAVDTSAVAENTTNGMTETGTSGFTPLSGTSGADGNLWFTGGPNNGNRVLRVPPGAPGSQFAFSSAISSAPNATATDAAGDVWFTEFAGGRVSVIQLAPAPTAGSPAIAPSAAQVGQAETCSAGSGWSGHPVFSYQWQRNGDPIAGASGAAYTPGGGDAGQQLACSVTGTNASGHATATSSAATVTGAQTTTGSTTTGSTTTSQTPSAPPPPAPTAALTDLTPNVAAGGTLTLTAAGSSIPAGQAAAGYRFQLGSSAGAQTANCPSQLPSLTAIVTRPVTSTATVTVTTRAGTVGSTTIPIAVTAAKLPIFHAIRRAAVSSSVPGAHAAVTGRSLGSVPAVIMECVPAGGGKSSTVKRSPSASSLRAAQQAPVSADAQLPDCAKELKVGIISGLGCFTKVDDSHPLPQAEAKLLCTHEKKAKFLSVGGCNGLAQIPPVVFNAALAVGHGNRTAAGHSASLTSGCGPGSVGYDAVYYSTQPVGIDGLEIDPVNGGAIVLARAGFDCTGFTKQDSAYLLSSDAVVKVGGLPITLQVPDYSKQIAQVKGAATCGQSAASALSQGSLSGADCLASVSLPPLSLDGKLLPQFHGPIDLSVSPEDLGVELGQFSVPDNVLPIPVLPSLPLSGSIKVSLTGVDAASAAIHVQLPGVLSDGQGHGLTGDTTLSLDNVHGLELNDLDIKVPSLAQIGLARVRNLEFHYKQPSYFDSTGSIDLSDVIHGVVTLHVLIDKGRFQNGQVSFASQAGDGVPLFGPLFLTQLSAGLTLNPVHIHGDTQLSVGPAVNNAGCGALGIHGTVDLAFGNPWTLDATGNASLVCVDLGPSRIFHADSDGHFSYGEALNFGIPGIGSITGDEFGQAYIDTNGQLLAQLDGKLAGNFAITPCHDFGWPVGQQCLGTVRFNPELDGTISLGYRFGHLVGEAGVCAKLNVNILGANIGFNVGAGTGDLPGAIASLATYNFPALASQFQILLDNCDISKWRLLPPPAGFARVRGHAAATGDYSFTMPAGQKVGVIGLEGSGDPNLLLTSPSGKHIQVSTDGIHLDDGALVIRQPSTGQVIVEVPHAQGGRWTIATAPGTTLRTVEVAHTLPAPVIHTRVTGSGAHRVLRYRIVPAPGLAVRFLEQVDRGASPLGVAHGRRGVIHFTPAIGSGRPRTIIARVTRNGQPAPSLTVGHYRPGVLVPGRARSIAIRGHGGRWRVSWLPGAFATGQQVTLRFADGAEILLAATRTQRAIVLARALAGGARPTAVEIVALRGQTRGRPAIAVAGLARSVSRRR